jgi:hypothetical protein
VCTPDLLRVACAAVNMVVKKNKLKTRVDARGLKRVVERDGVEFIFLLQQVRVRVLIKSESCADLQYVQSARYQSLRADGSIYITVQ